MPGSKCYREACYDVGHNQDLIARYPVVPTYDYRCTSNDRVVEVRHHMNETLSTWGELCALAGIEPGDTPLEAPVARVISGGQLVRRSSLGDKDVPACASGPCCGGGVCGLE